MQKPNIDSLRQKKAQEKLCMLTCYDYSFAAAVGEHVDLILVGDSLGNVVLGHDRTKHVDMDDMLRHVAAVRRGAPHTFIVGDLPHGAYETPELAITNAERLLQAGADAVKPEGRPEIIRALTDHGIEVMGHLGLLPQTAEQFGVVGREKDIADKLVKEAKAVEAAGAFSVVLEMVPVSLAQAITEQLQILTIGIGSGKETDGQVLVLYDMLGLYPDFRPKFVRAYADLKSVITDAVKSFRDDTKTQRFPSDKESFV